MDEPIQFTSQLTEKDIALFVRSRLRNSIWRISGLCAFVVFILISRDGDFIAAFVAALLVLGLSFPVASWRLARAASKQFASAPSLKAPTQFSVDGEGITSNSTVATSSVKWEAIDRVVETTPYFAVYLSNVMARLIPKRDLDAAVIERFRAAVSARGLLKDK